MCEKIIGDRVRDLLLSLPEGVLLVGAAKMRTALELRAAVEAGLPAIGHCYVQEAEVMRQVLTAREARGGRRVQWQLIGHLQRKKAKKASRFSTL